MRFQQRIDALSAEYQSETKVILEDELKECLEYLESDNEDTKQFTPEQVELFKKHATKYATEDLEKDDGLDTFFGRLSYNEAKNIKRLLDMMEDKE
jgi:hypothetical protein